MRFIRFILVIYSLFLFYGCIEGKLHIIINSDKSADFNYKIGFNEKMLNVMNLANSSPLEAIKEEFQKNGNFNIEEYSENNLIGLTIKKHYSKIDSINIPFLRTNTSGNFYEAKKNILKDRYLIDANINFPTILKKLNINKFLIGDNIKFTVMITFPVKPGKNNANYSKDNGKTLVWELDYSKDNKIYAEFEKYKVMNILLILSTLAGGFIYFAN